MDEDIDSLNKVLRSLVVSTPTQVDVRTLLRDYKAMVGKTLPISKFGYKDPVLFLKEKCSNSFVLQGPMSNPVLVLILNDSIKHIDKLVQKQRIPSSNKFKGKRRSVAESIIKSPPSNNIRSFETRSSERNRQITVNGDVPASQPVPPPPPPVHHHVQNKHRADSVPYNVSQQNLYKMRAALFNLRRSSSEKSTHYRDSRADDDSGRQTLSSTSSSKRTQLEELKQQVSDIISDHPEGVWATDLLGLYRERYQCELDFVHYGFTGILSLVYTLEHMNVSRQPNGDWLLSDARAPPPVRPLPPVRRRVSPPVDPDDALPGIPYAADVYPEDCLNFLESIPSPFFANVQPGGMLEVAVGEVYSPSHFWLFRLGEDHNIAMENIMDEMNQYYKNGEGKGRRLSRGAVRVGQYCSSCFEGDWHRSLIVKIVDSDTVKLRHVDYGTVDRVSVQGLRPLPRTWAKLEAQALRARLAGARPSAEGRRWPRAAAHYFLRLVRDKKFIANVVAVDPEDDALEVLLIDTSISEDNSITNELIRSGHADCRQESTVGVSTALCDSDSEADDTDIRTLISTILKYDVRTVGSDTRNVSDDESDVSTSASQLVGTVPKAIPTWECDSVVDAESVVTIATQSSVLSRIRALHARLHRNEQNTLNIHNSPVDNACGSGSSSSPNSVGSTRSILQTRKMLFDLLKK